MTLHLRLLWLRAHPLALLPLFLAPVVRGMTPSAQWFLCAMPVTPRPLRPPSAARRCPVPSLLWPCPLRPRRVALSPNPRRRDRPHRSPALCLAPFPWRCPHRLVCIAPRGSSGADDAAKLRLVRDGWGRGRERPGALFWLHHQNKRSRALLLATLLQSLDGRQWQRRRDLIWLLIDERTVDTAAGGRS